MRIKGHFSKSTVNFIVSAIFLLCGVIIGSISSSHIAGNTILELSSSISSIVNFDRSKIFTETLFSVFKYPMIIFLCGFTALGVLFVPVSLSIKGYSWAFSIGVLIRIYGSSGIWISVSVFAVQALILIPCLFVMSSLSLNAAKQQWQMFLIGKRTVFGPIFTKRYFLTLATCLAVLLLLIIFDVLVTPSIVSYTLKNVI